MAKKQRLTRKDLKEATQIERPQFTGNEYSMVYNRTNWFSADANLLPEFTPKEWVINFYNMLEDCHVSRAFQTLVTHVLQQVTFTIKPNENDTTGEYADIATKMFLDWESGSFNQIMGTFVSTYLVGFSVYELQLRAGETGYELDDLIFHPQISLDAYFEDRKLQGFHSKMYAEKIPLSRCFYVQGKPNNSQNVYGHSMLKAVFKNYIHKNRIMGRETIQLRRTMEGVNILRYDNVSGSKEDVVKRKQAAEAFVSQADFNRMSGIVLPSAPHSDPDGTFTSTKANDFEIASINGQKAFDTTALIRRENEIIAQALYADFLLLGSNGTHGGSYALSREKSSTFKSWMDGIKQDFCNEFYHQIVKPIWELNGMPFDMIPTLTSDNVDLSLDAMANYINALSNSGILVNDPKTEEYLRSYAGLPELTDAEREVNNGV
jgi:hypothetical protein